MEKKEIQPQTSASEKKQNNNTKPVLSNNLNPQQNDAPKRKDKRDSRYVRTKRKQRDGRQGLKRVVISTRRVARVVAGGRRFSLSVAVAVGNKNGKIGIGLGKGPDMATAIEKAESKANKNMVMLNLTKDKGISHDVSAKYCGSVVKLNSSKGFVAGGAVRKISELAGIKNINAKILSRSKNHLNNARATVLALQKCKN